MKKMVDNSKQVLNLYEMHETEVKEAQKKKRKLPIVLLIFGIILIVVGYFYNNIFSFLMDKQKKDDNDVVENDNSKLRCNYNTSDATMGVNYTYNNSYSFDKEMLKKSTNVITITPVKNSDIADGNIKVLSGKYNDIVKNMQKISGVSISAVLKENTLTVKYNIDYSVADLTKIPQNELITINNKLNDTYRTIKKQNQELGYLCQ